MNIKWLVIEKIAKNGQKLEFLTIFASTIFFKLLLDPIKFIRSSWNFVWRWVSSLSKNFIFWTNWYSDVHFTQFFKKTPKMMILTVFSDFLCNWLSDLYEMLWEGVSPHYVKTSFTDWIDSVMCTLLGFSKKHQKCWFWTVFRDFLCNIKNDIFKNNKK